jgi:hypothetical protein
MLNQLTLKPVALGALGGFVLPYFVSFWFKVSFLGDVKQAHIDSPEVDYTVAYLFLFVVGPLAGGAIAAHVSKHQPILHAVLAALAGWVFYAWLGAGVLLGILFVAVAAVGAVGWKKTHA